ncbi:ABC transporter permease [Nesterenkonia massiliensis]|uniref:ABC transporter permease n=1 Tax=Nesterenkonia massiliensis TaxID=1232429 RepID=UPI000412158C|nr:ABC transporter permease [Nesterenkonia massiliensis]
MTSATTLPPRVTEERATQRILGWIALPAGIALLVLVGSLLSEQFLTTRNLTNVLINMSLVGIIVVGMTFVFIVRGLADLSVPAMVAIGALLALGLQPSLGSIPAALVGILAASAAGLVNGVLIGYSKLNPVITTLATGTIVLGIAQASVGGVIVYGNDPQLQSLLTGRIFFGIPTIVLIFLAVALGGHLLLGRTTFGRWVYAAGSNPQATKASAVPLDFTKAVAFWMTATLAGFSGVLLGLTLQTARPGIGTGYEFDAITAVVVGGVSLLGGFGNIPRAIGGLLLVTLLSNIMVLNGIPTQSQGLVMGALIAGAVALDVYLRRRGGAA